MKSARKHALTLAGTWYQLRPILILQEDDLRRLMNVYQLWAHQMFPAGSFKDTITQVEKLCKKRAMKVRVSLSATHHS